MEVMRLTQELRAASTGAKGGSVAAERLKKELEKSRCSRFRAAVTRAQSCRMNFVAIPSFFHCKAMVGTGFKSWRKPHAERGHLGELTPMLTTPLSCSNLR